MLIPKRTFSGCRESMGAVSLSGQAGEKTFVSALQGIAGARSEREVLCSSDGLDGNMGVPVLFEIHGGDDNGKEKKPCQKRLLCAQKFMKEIVAMLKSGIILLVNC